MKRATAGYSMLEVLVAGSLMAIVFGIVFAVTGGTQKLVSNTAGKVEQFREARTAFDTMTRRLSQATLNTYWDYQYNIVSKNYGDTTKHIKVPVRYERGSELRFRSGPMAEFITGRPDDGRFYPTHGVFFQSPNGFVENTDEHGTMDHLLNTWGFFVEAGSDEEFLPAFVKGRVESRRRFRLLEVMEPSERLSVYSFQQAKVTDWFLPAATGRQRIARPLAENIVALVLLPKLAKADEDAQRQANKSTVLAPFYRYDSTQSARDPVLNPKHQLPPIVQVTMIALDENSARKLAENPEPAMGLDFSEVFKRPEFLGENASTTASGGGDIASFSKQLGSLHLSYRVFSTNVSIRGSKWSRSQEN